MRPHCCSSMNGRYARHAEHRGEVQPDERVPLRGPGVDEVLDGDALGRCPRCSRGCPLGRSRRSCFDLVPLAHVRDDGPRRRLPLRSRHTFSAVEMEIVDPQLGAGARHLDRDRVRRRRPRRDHGRPAMKLDQSGSRQTSMTTGISRAPLGACVDEATERAGRGAGWSRSRLPPSAAAARVPAHCVLRLGPTAPRPPEAHTQPFVTISGSGDDLAGALVDGDDHDDHLPRPAGGGAQDPLADVADDPVHVEVAGRDRAPVDLQPRRRARPRPRPPDVDLLRSTPLSSARSAWWTMWRYSPCTGTNHSGRSRFISGTQGDASVPRRSARRRKRPPRAGRQRRTAGRAWP